MREVVKAGEEAQNERDDDVEHDPGKVFPGVFAVVPGVEEVEKGEGNDAEEGARGAGRRDACCGVVAAEHEAKDAAADIDEKEADWADKDLHLFPETQL